jgi:hypothetical protein
VVDGQLMRHASWAECERRVKGRRGTVQESDERRRVTILRQWGFASQDLD